MKTTIFLILGALYFAFIWFSYPMNNDPDPYTPTQTPPPQVIQKGTYFKTAND